MRFTMVGLAALLGVSFGCRTYEVSDCRPECEPDDQVYFANCVAYGIADVCPAGNRMCCALETDCIGMLDDQQVVSTVSCVEIIIDQCAPECDAAAGAAFEQCLAEGSADCAPDDALCCSEPYDCLGALGTALVTTTATGCCFDATDCDVDQACDPMFYTCMDTTSGTCGDGVVQSDEACDPGPTVDLACTYGETSCTVCSELCQHVPGVPSFCGDGTIDTDAGETCDPPGAACSSLCERMLPAHCTDGRQNVDETDVDCGGPDCDPCLPDQGCREDRDCDVLYPECLPTSFCDIATGLGVCIELDGCDDGNRCTEDLCTPGEGCASVPLDVDGDGDGPESLGCGGDCDDFDRTSSSLMPSDLGCSSTEAGFGVDNDCDGFFDEDC